MAIKMAEVELNDRQRAFVLEQLLQRYAGRVSYSFVEVTIDFVLPSRLLVLEKVLDIADETGVMKVKPALRTVIDGRYLTLVFFLQPMKPGQQALEVARGVRGQRAAVVQSVLLFALRLLEERERIEEMRRINGHSTNH